MWCVLRRAQTSQIAVWNQMTGCTWFLRCGSTTKPIPASSCATSLNQFNLSVHQIQQTFCSKLICFFWSCKILLLLSRFFTRFTPSASNKSFARCLEEIGWAIRGSRGIISWHIGFRLLLERRMALMLLLSTKLKRKWKEWNQQFCSGNRQNWNTSVKPTETGKNVHLMDNLLVYQLP